MEQINELSNGYIILSFIVIDPKVLSIIIQITIRATIFKNSNQSFFKSFH
jgi:hypothetical protein